MNKAEVSPKAAGNTSFPQERIERYEKAMRQNQPAMHKRTIPAPRSPENNPGMSFIEVTESEIVSAESANVDDERKSAVSQSQPAADQDAPLSWQLQRDERLFSILSAHSDIDHPICAECSSMLLSSLNSKLVAATRERDAYASFLKNLQQAASKHKDQEASVNKELSILQKEEELALADLVQLEEQKKQLENELADLEEENKMLEKEEELFWQLRNDFNEQQHQLETEHASLQQKLAHDQKQLELLQRTNVYNDTFFISHDGNFGTINGLRLGRLANHSTDWPEINAAWGQTLLLLQTIAERLSFSFNGYKLRPLGSTSRIEKYEYAQDQPDTSRRPTPKPPSPTKTIQLELYSSGASFERIFQARRYDQAMVAFLDCLSQLGKHVERTSASLKSATSRQPSATGGNAGESHILKLPYAIDGDKIWARDRPEEAVSIKLGVGFSSDENFTKACKYVLTCCKYLLAHVSNLDSSKSAQP